MYCYELKREITWACCADERCLYHETCRIYNRGAANIARYAPAAV
ncbi:MAG: hypothetical protein ACXQT2_01480 [Methanotrichaceae archaeon]